MKRNNTSIKFEHIFEQAIDGIIIINARGLIEELNASALSMFGYKEEEVLGKNISILMPQPHAGAHDQYIHRYQDTGVAKIIGIGREVQGLRKDGSLFPFRLAVSESNFDGKTYFTGIIHDLSAEHEAKEELNRYVNKLEDLVKERTKGLKEANDALELEIVEKSKAESALIESQVLYKAIAENFPNGTIAVLNDSFDFLFIEGQGLKEIGYGTHELIGRNYLDVIQPSIVELVRQKLTGVLNGIPATFEIDSGMHSFRVRAVPLTEFSDNAMRILLVESNITHQKNAEKEIYNSLMKERELNDMKSKFVSMASHEFRTPLSTILSSSSLIEKYLQANRPEHVTKHTQRIKNNVRNLTMILNDFLSIEKLESDNLNVAPSAFDLKECILEVKEDMELLKKKNQVLDVHWDVTMPILVHSDRFVVQSILTNLISNAIKYSPAESTIQIRITDHNDRYVIKVIDKGIGISEEDQKKLFSRFFRASNAGNVQGTGLGLHIVKRYIALIKEELLFESQLNVGSSFGFTLKKTEE